MKFLKLPKLPHWYVNFWGMPNSVAEPQPAPSILGTIPVKLTGSLQNPAWSPDGNESVFTRFLNGYNKGPAELWIHDLISGRDRLLVRMIGHDCVSQPGSTWCAKTNEIIFSSDHEGRDQVYGIRADGRGLRRIALLPFHSCYEPSWSSDGRSFVFEVHQQGRSGQIVICDRDGTCKPITPSKADCRQPNWSPNGRHIVYQGEFGGRWELYLYDVGVGAAHCLTTGIPGDKTDATFSPEGGLIVFSGTRLDGSDGLMTMGIDGPPTRAINHGSGYFGAASILPDGKWIVAETSARDPDVVGKTDLVIMDFNGALS